MKKSYSVKRCGRVNTIDANWNKPFWKGVESAEIALPHWPVQSEHSPLTEVKLQYDDENLYVIFRVQDRYIRAVAAQIHDDVWKDSCVEFFFAPDMKNPDAYFNLEVNCCGIPLMQHHTGPRENSRYLDVIDCQKIRIAASASGPIRNEITKPLTWTLEYALPYEILTRYADFVKPQAGAIWHANFYKCADNCSHPHWMTWSPSESDRPDFHQPDYFGVLKFI